MSNKRPRRSCTKKEPEEVKSQGEFNNMNVHCIMRIFKEFPLQELVHLRSVCSNWNEIITNEICGPIKSIHIIILRKSFRSYTGYSSPDLVPLRHYKALEDSFPSFRSQLKLVKRPCNNTKVRLFLARLFPSIQNLFLAKHLLTPSDNELFNIWPKLNSFTLYYESYIPELFGTFFSPINQLKDLRTLNILIWNFSSDMGKALVDTFSRLESLTFNVDVHNLDILSQLEPFHLRQLTMHCNTFEFENKFASTLNQENPRKLVENLTHLTLNNITDELLRTILRSNFTTLKYLDLGFDYGLQPHIQLSSVLTAELLNFKKLEQLTLLNIEFHLDYGLQGKAPENLSSLKTLTLSYVIPKTATPLLEPEPGAWCERLAKILPNLEHLKVDLVNQLWDSTFKEELKNYSFSFKQLKSLTIEKQKFRF